MSPYRAIDRSKYIVKIWRIPYTFHPYVNGEWSSDEIHWSEYWESELNKYCLEQDVYLVSNSIVSGAEVTNPTDPRPEKDKSRWYGNVISCVFMK